MNLHFALRAVELDEPTQGADLLGLHGCGTVSEVQSGKWHAVLARHDVGVVPVVAGQRRLLHHRLGLLARMAPRPGVLERRDRASSTPSVMRLIVMRLTDAA